jgi:hypothetical protein
LHAEMQPAQVYELNVGGQKFSTQLETLTKDSGSRLAACAGGHMPVPRDACGAIFIDRWLSFVKETYL